MSRKKFQLFAMLMILFTGFVLPLTFIPVKAAGTYDGTYDYTYNFHDPTGWHTRSIPSSFIVNNGKISTKGGHTGSVDASGNAQFTGPCPCAAPRAVFTGVLKSDGTGKGTYKCQYCLGGSWAVSRVSGGGGVPGLPANLDPTNVTIAAVVGAATIAFVGALAHATRAKTKTPPPAKVSQPTRPKLKPIIHFPSSVSQIKPTRVSQLGYQASQPAPPPTSHEIPPSPIVLGPGAHLEGPMGEVRVGTSLPSALTLRSIWARGQVTLTWDRPLFDTSMYQLDGYDVSIMQYGPGSTSPVKTPVAALPPNSTQWVGPFNQTYRYSTGGDIAGYTVEALLREIAPSTGYAHTVRVGAMAYAPLP